MDMNFLYWLLLLAGFIFFVLATLGIGSPPRFQWIAAGLACWILVDLLIRSQTVFK